MMENEAKNYIYVRQTEIIVGNDQIIEDGPNSILWSNGVDNLCAQ